MDIPKNRLKAAMAEGRMQIGCWLGLASATAAEAAAGAGFDWCLIDAEHGPSGAGDILTQLRAVEGAGCPAAVRVPHASDWMLKRVLDMGAQNVLIPMVNSGEEAARMAAACRYPPVGTRGFGAGMARASRYNAIADYPHAAGDEICVMVQCESRAAVEDIDAIASAPGVDLVFIGPADLAADMGHLANDRHPEVEEAIDHALARIKAAGKPAGIIDFDRRRYGDYAERGVRFLGVSVDVIAMVETLRSDVRDIRARLGT